VKVFGDQRAQSQQGFALERDGGAFAKVHNTFDHCLWGREFASDCGQEVPQLIEQRGGKGVEHRHMACRYAPPDSERGEDLRPIPGYRAEE